MISNYKEPINLMIHFKTIPNGTFSKVSERERSMKQESQTMCSDSQIQGSTNPCSWRLR